MISRQSRKKIGIQDAVPARSPGSKIGERRLQLSSIRSQRCGWPDSGRRFDSGKENEYVDRPEQSFVQIVTVAGKVLFRPVSPAPKEVGDSLFL